MGKLCVQALHTASSLIWGDLVCCFILFSARSDLGKNKCKSLDPWLPPNQGWENGVYLVVVGGGGGGGGVLYGMAPPPRWYVRSSLSTLVQGHNIVHVAMKRKGKILWIKFTGNNYKYGCYFFTFYDYTSQDFLRVQA